MLSFQFIPSNFYPQSTLTIVTKKCQLSPWIYIQVPLPQKCNKSANVSSVHSSLVVLEKVENVEEEQEESKIKWHDIGPNITEAQGEAISQLPPKMTNRCKALMKRIICLSTQDENLSLVLAAWVKAMKPRRSDWLSVLKEMKSSDNLLFLEVMECALLEDSFEANVRDYTKLIDTYAKRNQIKNAELAFQAMKSRGFPCDQVTLTVLINMYSKAGHLDQAKESFQEIQLLGLPLDKRAYGSMIMAYVRAGMLNLAESLMKEMEAKEIYAGREVYKALLRAYSNVGDADGAQRVFDAIQFARIVPDDKICALLVNAYCAGGHTDKALSVLENMKTVGINPNEKCIATMLGAYERENRLDKALAFLKDLEDEGTLIGQEATEVLERWFQSLGVVDDELQHALRELSPEKKARLKLWHKNRIHRGIRG